MKSDNAPTNPTGTAAQLAQPYTATMPAPPNASEASARAADGGIRFKFVGLQVSYYMAQMTIGEAKAGGILAFLAILCSVTAERLRTGGTSAEIVVAGLLAIGLSVVASVFAFLVIWPRRTGTGPEGNVFSWVRVSRTTPAQHVRLLMKASEEQLTCDVAVSMVDIALIIRKKYRGIRHALTALIPAMALHVLTWVLASQNQLIPLLR